MDDTTAEGRDVPTFSDLLDMNEEIGQTQANIYNAATRWESIREGLREDAQKEEQTGNDEKAAALYRTAERAGELLDMIEVDNE